MAMPGLDTGGGGFQSSSSAAASAGMGNSERAYGGINLGSSGGSDLLTPKNILLGVGVVVAFLYAKKKNII